jgi:hypothetical protein
MFDNPIIVSICIVLGAVALYFWVTSQAAQKRLAMSAVRKTADRLELMRLCNQGDNSFLRAIVEANPTRSFGNIERRFLKIGEELGEACEAYLVASTTNKTRKKKTYADVREECIDLSIVGLDCALTRFPGEENLTDEDIEFICMEVLATKLAKWKRQKDAQVSITDELTTVDDAV